MTRPCVDHGIVGCIARVDCRLLQHGEQRREQEAARAARPLPPYELDPMAWHREHPPWQEAGSASLAVFFAACVLGALVFLAVLALGQDVMCAAHDDALRYCEVQP